MFFYRLNDHEAGGGPLSPVESFALTEWALYIFMDRHTPPTHSRQVRYEDVAGAEIVMLSPGVMKDGLSEAAGMEVDAELDRFWVAPHLRGKGFARALLGAICKDADAVGAVLCLAACPMDAETNLDGVVRLYESFGFVALDNDGDNCFMVRRPT